MAEGYVNIPMGDRAAVRLVGWYDRDGGYIDNVPGSRTYPTCNCTDTNTAFAEDDYNDVETYGGRVALRFDLNENWTVTPGADGPEHLRQRRCSPMTPTSATSRSPTSDPNIRTTTGTRRR